MAKTILIIDDDPTQRRLLQAVVEKQGFATRLATDGETGLDIALNSDNALALILLDLGLPRISGMEVLAILTEKCPELPVLVLTASGSIDTVVQAMRKGAADFFVKPASHERIMISVRNALKVSDLRGEVKRLKKTAQGKSGFSDMIAYAPTMRQVIRLGERAACSNIPVLILGESGVGKEKVARSIQGGSQRAANPFIMVNCGAIPENLVESILFGHEKGAFTGAINKNLGKFVEADGGTLFLDEVGELPRNIQVKLLRVLQEGEVDAIGSRRPTRVDVRIISATNKNLADLVNSGKFREDLYYRLNVFPIDVPPLRERPEDIPILVEHFIQRYNAQENKSIIGASPKAIQILCNHSWPGNVRQLENTVFRAMILSDGDVLEPNSFSHIDHLQCVMPHLDDESDIMQMDLADYTETQALMAPVPIIDAGGDVRSLEAVERDLIEYAIQHYSGRMSQVARQLGIGRSTLYRKVREYDIKIHENTVA